MKTKITICDLCGQMTEEGDTLGGKKPFVLGFVVDDSGNRHLTDSLEVANSHVCMDCIKSVKKYTLTTPKKKGVK
jgi:hypothetical protein